MRPSRLFVIVAAAAVLAGLVKLPRVLAQSATADGEKAAGSRVSFDVASVKVPPDQNHFEVSPELSPGRFRWTAQGWNFVMYAYHLQSWQISGQTSLLSSIYQIDATTDPHATDTQEREMVRSLLIYRFKMVAHRSSKSGEGYALTVANGGPKLEVVEEGEATPTNMRVSCGNAGRGGWVSASGTPEPGVTAITGCNATLTQLTDALDRVLQTVVVNQTGIDGRYDFAFKYMSDPDAVSSAPSLAAAVSDLGLHLAKYKGPIENLVIDHIEQPSPN
ncbi:MAG TPA: TIGR03435 family protein [Candidatus Acidoferrales bacterium]